MKKVAAVLAAVFMCSSAFGGTVAFDPVRVEIDPLVSTIGTFDVSVATADQVTSFTSVDIIMGSNDGLALTDFVLDPTFATLFLFNAVDIPANPTVYASDIKAGGFGIAGQSAPILVGTLTFDAAGLDPGDYTIMVDSDVDGGRTKIGLATATEGLFGSAVVTVIPEPATISLLAFGALALICRRKSA